MATRLEFKHVLLHGASDERFDHAVPVEDQLRLGIGLVVLTGLPSTEVVRYVAEHHVDLAIVQPEPSGGSGGRVARALLDESRCGVVVLR